MFVTYHPRKDSTQQDCSGTTVSLLEQIDINTYRVSGYNNEGLLKEWIACASELTGDLPGRGAD